MKHYPPPQPHLSEDQLKASLRAQLDCTDAGRAALAARLGITAGKLSLIMRGQCPMPDDVAGRLGFRRVSLFEPI